MKAINKRTSYTLASKFVAAFIVALTLQATTLGQTLKPMDQQPKSQNELERIYNLTEYAKTVDDYQRIIERCEKLLANTIVEGNQKYLKSLLAWSRNRLGQRHLLNSESMQEMGLDDRSKQELQNAIAQFDLVIKQYPQTWRAWMGRAKIHAQNGEYVKALEKFKEVNRLNLKNQNSRFNCAEICSTLGRFQEAIEFYNDLVDRDPTDAQSLTGRGHAWMELKKFDKAVEDYRTVVNLTVNDSAALTNLADAYRSSGQNDLLAEVKTQIDKLSVDREARADNPNVIK